MHTSSASARPAYFRVVLVSVVTLVLVWPVAGPIVLTVLYSVLGSLAAALAVMLVVVFPLCLWGLSALLRRLRLLPATPLPWPQAVGGAVLLFVIWSLCLFGPLLRDFGFRLPVSSARYRYDSCVLSNGAGKQADRPNFICVERDGTLLREP